MAQERLCMRRIKEVLRLRHELNMPQRKIAAACGIGKTTVQEYINRARSAGLVWPLPEGLGEEELEKKLFPEEDVKKESRPPMPLQYLYEEKKIPNVTMSLLWEEYKQNNPAGYQRSWFCEQYRRYIKTLDCTMHQEYKAGEKGFVDFGDGKDIINPETGEITKTEIFVHVLGASKKTYVEAVVSENMESWIRCNVNALEYFGCCPRTIVPDNLKAAVTKANKYEPVINDTTLEFSGHYHTTILPARVREPRDKPLVENGVGIGKRFILARLRHKIFHSIGELNAAIRPILDDLNSRTMKKYGKSRNELFETLDKPYCLPLPEKPYEYAEWSKARVNIDSHIAYKKHFYSVPYEHVHKLMDIRATGQIIEVCLKSERICSHRRGFKQGGYTTVTAHMPRAHREYAEWTPERMLSWIETIGPDARKFAEILFQIKKCPEQAYKSCMGVINLKKHFPPERINLACRRAIKYNIFSYSGVKEILSNNLDMKQEDDQHYSHAPKNHANIRGPEYFNGLLFEQNKPMEDPK